MKILYVGPERDQAQAIATAVRHLGESVRVSWTSRLDQVAKWTDETSGPRALVVEADPNGPAWRSVLAYAAGHTALPVVVIVPGAPLPLALGAYECIARSPSLLQDLPAAITRAIDRKRQPQTTSVPRLVKSADRVALDAERDSERLERLQRLVEGERAARADLEQKLAQATAAVRETESRHQLAAAAAAEQLAKSHSQHEIGMARAAAARDMVDEQFREAAIEVERARGSHASAVAEAERLSRREAQLSALLDTAATARAALERRLEDAESALGEGEARAAEERRAVAALLAERQRELQAALSAARELEEQLRQERAALATATRELADRQTQFDRARAQGESARADLTTQLRDVQAARADLTAQLRAVEEARDQAQREHQSVVADVARLTEREAELDDRLQWERTTRDGLEQAVAEAAVALRDERQQHGAALADLTTQLRAIEEARDEARREHQSAAAEITRMMEREAGLTSELADVWAVQRMLDLRLSEVVRASSDAAERAAAERQAAAACQTDLEGRLARADTTMEGLQRALAETRGAALEAERRLTEEANALRSAALVQAVRFDDRFEEQRRVYESRLAEAQEINNTLSHERDGLQQSLRTAQEEFSRFDREHRAARERLEQAQTEASAAIQQLTAERRAIEARFEADRSGFQASLDRLTREHAAEAATRESAIEELRVSSRADNHRLFQQASLPMFRCTKDGALTQANRMLTTLVGVRSSDELGGADFAASVFESPNDLSWLIERCLGSRGKEVTETTWRRKDGTRLLVRLSACATSTDLIECGVEDLTPVRVLQDRLSQAHRMEAVGRLASEVAVTCGNLLRGVHQNTQEWLTTDGSHTASRQRGEMLLEEMSRAAGLLSQLAAYGDEESCRPAVVELSAVVRDIAPVLKRVAGDAVEVRFPASSTRLNVDASAERVQRLLVNLAAYGRERMPGGGRLKIELGTIVVDRHFTAKHPNVRLGPHALVTVTESRRTAQTGGPLRLHDTEAGSGSQASVAVQPSVDLGTMQELVGECGGHLWMTVQPLGDMVVKIRLPLLTSYGQPQSTSAPGGRVRAIASWFQH